MMNVDALEDLVRDAARDVLVEHGVAIPRLGDGAGVVRSRRASHGDYATSLALRHAAKFRLPARQVAEWLADALALRPGIATAEVAGPGFVNLTLTAEARGGLVDEVRSAGVGFGTGDELVDHVVRLGPRAADPGSERPLVEQRRSVVDDALERVVVARGARVSRADGGSQTPVGTSVVVTDPSIRTFRDLVDRVGEDTARYAFLRCPVTHPLEVDVSALTTRTEMNPVFEVLHAHARLTGVSRNGADLGVEPGTEYGLLEHPREGDLIRTLGEFPEVVRAAAELREPHRVARYLEALAGAYHKFYDSCRVLPMGDEEITDLHRARLGLCVAARQVLANGLGLLGVSAPERM